VEHDGPKATANLLGEPLLTRKTIAAMRAAGLTWEFTEIVNKLEYGHLDRTQFIYECYRIVHELSSFKEYETNPYSFPLRHFNHESLYFTALCGYYP